jgi:phospholipid/cholesterol/gamma-HCH transport system substrate-binding protein
MEIRARYILMGLFLLAVIAGGFAFTYWLENAGGFRDRETYRIRFGGPVSGLLSGSSVLFNGIRVGEVTALRISADRPNEVHAEIELDAGTPVRNNTIVDIEYQGLTGVASIALTGGQGGTPLPRTAEGPPTLAASASAGQTITYSARLALLKLNSILDENSEPFKELVANLNEFSGALSRNSDKVDGILSGLERMTGGARGPDTDKIYDLTAPKRFGPPPKPLPAQLTVPLPTAIFQVDSQNIMFRPAKDAAPLPPGARWADNLTRLVQAKITQSFENAGYIDSVSHSDAVTGDYQLLIDLRNFQIITGPEPTAEVEYSAKIADTNGKILGAKLFRATAPATSTETGPALAALNEAFQLTATDLVAWAPGVIPAAPEPAPEVPEAPAEMVPDTPPAETPPVVTPPAAETPEAAPTVPLEPTALPAPVEPTPQTPVTPTAAPAEMPAAESPPPAQ